MCDEFLQAIFHCRCAAPSTRMSIHSGDDRTPVITQAGYRWVRAGEATCPADRHKQCVSFSRARRYTVTVTTREMGAIACCMSVCYDRTICGDLDYPLGARRSDLEDAIKRPLLSQALAFGDNESRA